MLVIAICTAICGTDDWVVVAEFGRAKQQWLGEFLELPHGIPAHDTFGAVFRVLDAEQFGQCFVQWVQAVNEVTAGQILPLDGKQLRRTHDKSWGKAAIHMVSARATQNHVVLGQVKVADKSNEITAMPQLLELLELSGCIVTIDALGCQREIARQIVVDKDADYVLALKNNQPDLFADVQEVFDQAQTAGFATAAYWRTAERGPAA